MKQSEKAAVDAAQAKGDQAGLREAVRKAIVSTIEEIAGLEARARTEAATGTSLRENGMDSLDHVEVIMALEDDLGIEIDDDSAWNATLDSLTDYIISKK